jgi:hypothetical protein
MIIIRLLVILVIFSASLGCARYVWQHPYKDVGTFNQEKGQCNQQSFASHPVQMQQQLIMAGYQTQSTTNCYQIGYSMQCNTIPGRYVPPVYANVDVNQSGRNDAFKMCMEGNGWSYVKEVK